MNILITIKWQLFSAIVLLLTYKLLAKDSTDTVIGPRHKQKLIHMELKNFRQVLPCM